MTIFKRFKDLIERSQNIIVTTHIHPDADGIGSQIALCIALRSIGKNAICINEAPLLERYKYLDKQDLIISYDQFKKEYSDFNIDLFVVTDTNNLNRIGSRMKDLEVSAKDLLYIDHHPCEKELQAIHCIDTEKAATGELVGELIEKMGIEFTQEIALPLYTAILIDTSSFRYPTVTSNTHRIISMLMKTGIKPEYAYNKVYGTKHIGYVQYLGKILSNSQTNKNGTISWLTISLEHLDNYKIDVEDTHAFINHLLILDDIKVVCMFRELENNKVKVSLRSTGGTDVGLMAQAIGGGGHNHSAATIIEGDLKTVVDETIKKLDLMIKN